VSHGLTVLCIKKCDCVGCPSVWVCARVCAVGVFKCGALFLCDFCGQQRIL